jgi:hypothetical protein
MMTSGDTNTTGKSRQYKVRQPYHYVPNHINDSFSNLGYDYRGNILKNTTSSELWANPQQNVIIRRLEGILLFLIESAKNIKKQFSIAHSEDTTLIK